MGKAKFRAKKKFKFISQPLVGSFALEIDPPKDVRWDHCREQFAAKFNESIEGFYFSHPIGKSYDIGEFINKFELIIGVENYTEFAITEKQNILWIKQSDFWTNCQIKRSLFTILIRCGMNYDAKIDNFDDVLFGEYKENIYLKETKSALLRFMFGFTYFTGKINNYTSTTVVKHGWKEEFSKLDNSTIRRRLILPDCKKIKSSIVGLESLWL